ncbi:outer lipoprotein subunit [Serratia phage vB_SmaM-Kamaji]|nr:outer lipoprotein subunit [Serratia phage vB_SmaM-Kamaji]
MHFWKYGVVCALGVILSGCATKEQVIPPPVTHVPAEPVKVDPNWPKPITACKVDSLKLETRGVSTGDEGVVLTIPYKDSLDFRVCQEDKLRYIKDLTAMMCTYREHLDEARCKPYKRK